MTMFQRQFGRRVWAGLVAAGALVIVAGIAVRAEQGQGGGGRGGMVPMTASTIARNPAAHMGAVVSMMATVEAQLSKTVFTVDQDEAKTGQEILIIAPTLQTPPQANAYVTIQGEVFTFDPAEVAKKAKDYKIDLPPDAATKYNGRPALIATSVINDKFIDVAKRLPPPMNAEEEAFSKVMKQVAPAFAALRAGVDKSDVENANKNAAVLKQAFTDTEAFFKPKKPDATAWAAEARKHVETIQASVAAGKWDEAKTTAGTLQQACGRCHGQYRERFDDGSFRYKPGN